MPVNRDMSYDPPRPPRHRATMPTQAHVATTEPPWQAQQWPSEQWPAEQWPAETAQGQLGYADSFDGARGYDGYQDQGGGGGYQDQAGYQVYGTGPQQSYGGYQDQAGYQGQAGYQDQVGYQGYPDYQGHGNYQGQGGYQGQNGGYGELGDGFDGAAGNYQDPRSSGPMLTAPDQGGWGGIDQETRTADRRGSRGIIVGAVMGFLAAAVAIGIATLAAAFFRPQASPIIAVGEWFIDHTPSWLKEFAIQKFGQHDKTMLLLGMYVTIALLAIGIGVLARRLITIGIVGVAVFGLFGAYIAYTRPASKFSDVIPSVIGGIAGVAALLWLAQAAAVPDPARTGSARQARRGRYQ